MTVLPKELYVNLIDIELANWIKDEIRKNEDFSRLEQIEKSIWANKDIVTLEGFIFIDGKQYIPDNTMLKRELVKKLHDTLPSGHPGELEMVNKVPELYWWPGLT